MALAATLLFSGTFALAQTDDRLMSDSDYRAFLRMIAGEVPTWKATLKSIDPENDPRTSYALGKMIVGNRDAALTEADYVRDYVAKQQQKHTVSGELALWQFLKSLDDLMDQEDGWELDGLAAHSDVEKYLPELNAFSMRIGNDEIARVALLEKQTCP